ncbi:MAG TPA: thiamine pyrophosphate-dependent enzyme [Alphaproteobacteria bacterium]|nr:thiamine pyrophosphate-dependent enzyme [Alphaproteobacteria bacterium]
MGLGYDTIAFKNALCDGCGDCMTACAEAKSGSRDPARARLQILPPQNGSADGGSVELALCRQCGEPKCAMVCPSGALKKNAETGVIDWQQELCVDCLLCTAGCAYAGIASDAEAGQVAKCDLCAGDPACTAACPTGALEFITTGAIYNDWGSHEDMFVPGLAACQGCNSELLIRHTMRRVGPNSVVATPPGCIPGMGTVGYNGITGSKMPVFHPLLTNTGSMLSGIKRYYNRKGRDVTVMALAGDGGTVDVGFQSLSGAAERDEQILYICVDNEGYMNTGMQASGSTTYGSWTSTTPVGSEFDGKRGESKHMPLVMMMHNCRYVATASMAYMSDYYAKLDKAIEASQRGMAYLHVYAPCPSGWRFAAADTIEICRKMVETNFVTLWEYEPDTGLEFTRPTDRPLPLAEYIDLLGKYRHINDDQRAHIQSTVERRLAMVAGFVR